MAERATTVHTSAKSFGKIFSNQGVVAGDISGYAQMIGSSLVFIDIDFILNLVQALKQIIFINNQASCYSQ